jgi:hypothetical protein
MPVNSMKKDPCKKFFCGSVRRSVLGPRRLVWLSLTALLCSSPALTQSQQPPPGTVPSAGQQQPDQQLPGSISGTVVDPSGAAVARARVRLTREDQTLNQDVLSDDAGQFSFANISSGAFQLTTTAESFATQTSSGIVHPGEISIVPRIVLILATETTEVTVTVPRVEVATGPMPFLSPRSKSSSLPGRRQSIQSLSSWPGALREFSRHKITSLNMGRALRVMQSASVRPMLTRLQARSSEAPSCHRS